MNKFDITYSLNKLNIFWSPLQNPQIFTFTVIFSNPIFWASHVWLVGLLVLSQVPPLQYVFSGSWEIPQIIEGYQYLCISLFEVPFSPCPSSVLLNFQASAYFQWPPDTQGRSSFGNLPSVPLLPPESRKCTCAPGEQSIQRISKIRASNCLMIYFFPFYFLCTQAQSVGAGSGKNSFELYPCSLLLVIFLPCAQTIQTASLLYSKWFSFRDTF